MEPVRSAREVQRLLEDVQQHLAREWAELASVEGDLGRAEVQWRQVKDVEVAEAERVAKQGFKRAEKGIVANVAEVNASAISICRRAAAILAPGALSAPWSDAVWQEPEQAPVLQRFVRLGETAGEGGQGVPVLLPLVEHGNWQVQASDDDFRSLVQGLLLRLFFTFNPARVRVVVYDPDLTLDTALFSELRQISRDACPSATTSVEEFEARLEVLIDELTEIDDALTSRGFDTLWGSLGGTDRLDFPIRVLVLNGSVSALSDRGQTRLTQLLRIGPERGLVMIGRSVIGLPRAVRLSLGQLAQADGLGSAEWKSDDGPSRSLVLNACAALAKAPRLETAPSVDFATLVREIQNPWMETVDEGMEAVIGVAHRNRLTLHLRSEDPPMPNVLVGGAVGQGKSNLLLVLIHSLAARYSPADLHMVLVDLRDGVEFARLGPDALGRNWLPHVRVLGLEYDQDFSMAVLLWVVAEMTERSEKLKRAGVSKLGDFRRETGETIPRLLIVIDEFQRLFEGDDEGAQRAAALLEQVARTGRGFGIHLVLASQTITGIRGLALKQDAIFGQFHNRLCLKNTPAESQAILSPQNTAAANLEHRGEVILNDNLGVLDSNTRGTVAKADDAFLSSLRQRLWTDGGTGVPPQVFRASAFARWPGSRLHSGDASSLIAAVGAPIAIGHYVREIRLTRGAEQSLVVLGSDRRVALSVLCRAVHSAVVTARAGLRMALLDADAAPGAPPSAWLASLMRQLETADAVVTRVGRDDIARFISEMDGPAPAFDLVVPIALDGIDLDTPQADTFVIPSEKLREVMQTGSIRGVFMIGWWQSRVLLERQLGFGCPGVRAWAMCGVTRDDVLAICGPQGKVPQSDPRFLWYDRIARGGPETLVPFEVSDLFEGTSLD